MSLALSRKDDQEVKMNGKRFRSRALAALLLVLLALPLAAPASQAASTQRAETDEEILALVAKWTAERETEAWVFEYIGKPDDLRGMAVSATDPAEALATAIRAATALHGIPVSALYGYRPRIVFVGEWNFQPPHYFVFLEPADGGAGEPFRIELMPSGALKSVESGQSIYEEELPRI